MRTNLNRFLLLPALAIVLASAASAQRLMIETDTQEGMLLQQVDAEQNPAKRSALLEQFAKTFPNHEAVVWVLGQLQAVYLEAKQYDKVLEAGTRTLGLDPEDVAAAHNCLKAAEAKRDVELIRRWSEQTSMVARRVKQSKSPDDPSEVEDWKAKVEYAKQVEQYTEYALYFAALQAKEPKLKNSLMEALETRNPMSEYLAQLRTSQTTVVRQVDIEEAVIAAEQQFKAGQYDADLLLMVATHYMSKRRESEKVIAYSNKVIELVNQKGKPAEMSDADWDRKRKQMLGTSYWMSGLLYSTREQFAAADRALRNALPMLRNSDMVAGALYHLGYVNYRLAEGGERIRIHDAIRFTKECININSAVQAQAVENLKSMKSEYNIQD
jgi:tetratricopeptide (TPR) repeat protein